MPLKIPSHQLGNERNSSIQKQLTSQGFGLTGKPLLRDSGQAEETGCPGLAGLGKETTVAVCLLGGQQCCAQPLGRGEDGVVAKRVQRGLVLILRAIISAQMPGLDCTGAGCQPNFDNVLRNIHSWEMLQLFSGPLATTSLWPATGFQCLGVLPLALWLMRNLKAMNTCTYL